MASLVNNAVFTAASGGTGAFSVSAALTGYQTPAAAHVTDGKVYSYRAQSSDLTQWEIGTTVASVTATIFTRVVVESSAGGTTTVNFTNPPTVAIVTMAADILQFDDAMALTASQQTMGRSNIMAAVQDLWERIGAVPSMDMLPDDMAYFFTTLRATTATYWGSDGLLKIAAANVPRLDYDPATRQLRGLLLESGETNLCLRSQELDNAYWGKVGTTVSANAGTAVDGTVTADKLVEDTSTGFHYAISSFITITSGNRITGSVFVEAAGRTKGQVRLTGAGGLINTHFDLVAGTVSNLAVTGPFSAGSSGIVDCGNGRYRVWVSALSTGITVAQLLVILCDANDIDSYTGNGASGMNFWGMDVKANTFTTYASSYVPTTSATVARAADVSTMPVDATWYNAVEGTLFLEMTPIGVQAGASAELIALDDSVGANSIRLRFGNIISGTDATAASGGVSQADTSSYTLTAGVRTRLAFSYALNDFIYGKDGVATMIDTVFTVPVSINRFVAISNLGGAHYLHRLAYFPKKQSAVNLNLLTKATA